MNHNTLLKTYTTLLPWNLARRKCFVSMILGMVSSGSVQQHKTAIGFSGYATQSSVCARIRDFLRNFTFDFVDIAKAVVTISEAQGPFDLVIDRTNWKFGRRDINLLVLAMVIHKQFAIPLFWKALDKQGSSNAQERIDLLNQFIEAFGIERIGSLMGDREFIGKTWIDFLIQRNIPLFIRSKGNRVMDLMESKEYQFHLQAMFEHLKPGQKRFVAYELDGHHLYFAGTRSTDGDLVIIMSNQDQGAKILKTYRKRWTIELMFKHCKNNGFNLEDTHLRHLDRIEKLLAVVVSALLLCFKAGKKEEQKKPTPHKKTVSAPAFCIFRRGFDFLRKLLFSSKQKALKLLASLIPTSENMGPSR
jgi:Transposase DDE domain